MTTSSAAATTDRTTRRKKGDCISVYVVDDHPIVCRGLVELINQQPDLTVCGQADSAEAALTSVADLNPGVNLADLTLKGMSGLDLVKSQKARRDEFPVLVLSMHDERLWAERAIRAGAKGYVMKTEETDKLLEALRAVAQGRTYVSECVRDRIVEGVLDGSRTASESPLSRLSDRELEVFLMIGQGMRTRDIAERLHLAVKTVEAYRANIKEKLGLGNYMDLIKAAVIHMENGAEG